MWTTIYIGSSEKKACELKNKLEDEGFLAKIKASDATSGEKLYQVLTPEFEAEEIQSYMQENGIV